MDDAEFMACRAAFVAKIKKEDEFRDGWAKQSVKAHWTGPRGGFASDGMNNRWKDFQSGWVASRLGITAQEPTE